MKIAPSKTNALFTVIGNALILLVIGILLLSLFIGQQMIDDLVDDFSYELELEDGLSKDDISNVIQLLEDYEFVDQASVQYIGGSQLAEEFQNDLDVSVTQDMLQGAFADVIRLRSTSRFTSADVIRIKRTFQEIPLVAQVNHIEDMTSGLYDNLGRLRWFGFLLSVVLCTVLVILMFNNTRLSIYAERFKIHKMQLVGAIPWFIARPFVIKAAWLAMVAAAIAIGIIVLLFALLGGGLISMDILEGIGVIVKVGLFLLVISITISVISSYVIVNRYLRMDINQLYR